MAFSEDVKKAAYARAGGRCECNRKNHNHPSGRCTRRPASRQDGEFHHIKSVLAGGSDTLSNCEFLCKPCHKATDSYGRS